MDNKAWRKYKQRKWDSFITIQQNLKANKAKDSAPKWPAINLYCSVIYQPSVSLQWPEVRYSSLYVSNISKWKPKGVLVSRWLHPNLIISV